jgi:glycosyltransferase involved in cell wall biosynthesis
MSPGPVQVVLVDLDREVPAIPATRYRAALVFGVRAGRLVGQVSVDLPVTGPELAGRLAEVAPADAGAPPRPADAELPFVSVVLPALFGRDALLDAVKALCGLDYPRFEVIVVDNRPEGMRDERDWARLGIDPRVRVLAEFRPGISAARNAGIRAAGGELIAFTDDDVEVDSGWLRAIAGRFLAEPDADCVTGPVLPKELETPAQLYFEGYGFGRARTYRATSYHTVGWFRVHDADGQPVGWLYQLGPYGTGANMTFRTEVLRGLGGFDEALGAGTPTRAGEDIALFVRLLFAGRRLAVEPGGFVFHTHRRSDAELRQQIHGYGSGLTAMLTGLALRDPRHLLGYARVVAPALAAILRRRPGGGPAPGPAGLAGTRRCGLLHGPADYLRSRHRMRRWNR